MWTGFFGMRNQVLAITISSGSLNVNLRTLANAAGYLGTVPATLTFTVPSGGLVRATSTALAAITTGSFPSNATLILVNNGVIHGMGGQGGNGGTICGNSTAGSAGGPGIDLNHALTIDNISGYIFGGGGGGGGGSSGFGFTFPYGGGGGGGAGGGSPGSTNTTFGATSGTFGTTGISGTGGTGGTSGGIGTGGDGGNGGGFGASGATSTAGGKNGGAWCGEIRAGGAAGNAIRLIGNSVTWLGGNNASQVKGGVS